MDNASGALVREHIVLSSLYKALAWSFLPPSFLSRKDLEEIHASFANPNIPPLLSEVSPILERIASKLEEALRDPKAWEKIVVESTRLFISNYKYSSCPPYESIYVLKTPPKKRTIAIPAIVSKLRRYYNLLGFQLSYLPGVTEDHISVELEFLSALHYTMAFNKGNSDLSRVHREYTSNLAYWIPDFTDCVIKHAKIDYMRDLAYLLYKLISVEKIFY